MIRRILAAAAALVVAVLVTSTASAAPVAGLATLSIGGRPAATASGPHFKLSPATGPPTSSVTVSGTGFAAHEAVDIYFDTTDGALAATSATGSFHGITIGVPGSAAPGTHWVTAVGRHSGVAAQARFAVSTNWAQFRFSGNHKGVNPYENVLSPATAPGIDEDWSFTTGGFVDSSPAVANRVVYVGSDDDLYALSASTGAQLWNFTTGGVIISSPSGGQRGGLRRLGGPQAVRLRLVRRDQQRAPSRPGHSAAQPAPAAIQQLTGSHGGQTRLRPTRRPRLIHQPGRGLLVRETSQRYLAVDQPSSTSTPRPGARAKPTRRGCA